MNYRVNLFISKFGFYAGILFVILATVGGFLSKEAGGAIGAFFLSLFLMIPFLMFCEGMHALVPIANNTKKGGQ